MVKLNQANLAEIQEIASAKLSEGSTFSVPTYDLSLIHI